MIKPLINTSLAATYSTAPINIDTSLLCRYIPICEKELFNCIEKGIKTELLEAMYEGETYCFTECYKFEDVVYYESDDKANIGYYVALKDNKEQIPNKSNCWKYLGFFSKSCYNNFYCEVLLPYLGFCASNEVYLDCLLQDMTKNPNNASSSLFKQAKTRSEAHKNNLLDCIKIWLKSNADCFDCLKKEEKKSKNCGCKDSCSCGCENDKNDGCDDPCVSHYVPKTYTGCCI